MNSDDERQILRRAALAGIGRALRRLYEAEHSEAPENIRQLTSQIEAKPGSDDRK
jgi:hypothetical protein